MPNFCITTSEAIHHIDGPLTVPLSIIGAYLFAWLLFRILRSMVVQRKRAFPASYVLLPAILLVVVVMMYGSSLYPPLPLFSGINTAAKFYGFCGK